MQLSRAFSFVAISALVLLVGLGSPSGVVAQQGSTGRVIGQVLDATTGTAVAGVAVRIPGAPSGALTNREGRFVVEDVPPGSRTVELDHDGVMTEKFDVDVRPGHTSYVEAESWVAMQPASELDRLLDLLVARGVLSASEVSALREEAARAREDSRVRLSGQDIRYEPALALRDDQVRIQVLPLGIESWDGSSRFRVRGRMQLDAGRHFFGEGMEHVARQGHPFPEYGVIFRRIRLGVAGINHGRWEWQVEADYAENLLEIANVYVGYLFDHGRIAFGHFKEPFGMEYQTSSRYISFIERSAASDAYKVNREPGIMYQSLHPTRYIGIGISGAGIDYNREVREGWGVSARGSIAPIFEDGERYLHLGAGVNHRKNAWDMGGEDWLDLRLRTREGTRTIDARLIGRDDLVSVENFTRMNAELAGGLGSWWFQGEYLRVHLNLDRDRLVSRLGGNATDAESLVQHGWYGQTGFFLTGETRNYRPFLGNYGVQTPNRNLARGEGFGAIELLARYSVANSLEHTRPDYGQKLTHYTIGMNWYLNPQILLRLNAMYLDGERDFYRGEGWMFGSRLQLIY